MSCSDYFVDTAVYFAERRQLAWRSCSYAETSLSQQSERACGVTILSYEDSVWRLSQLTPGRHHRSSTLALTPKGVLRSNESHYRGRLASTSLEERVMRRFLQSLVKT